MVDIDGRVIIFGAGGHAKACAEVIESLGFEIVAFISNKLMDSKLFGIQVIQQPSDLEILKRLGTANAFVAIGENDVRNNVFSLLADKGFNLPSFISPKSNFSNRVKISEGCIVMPGAFIGPDSVFGDGVIVNSNASIDHDCKIGHFSHVGPGATLAGGIELGSKTLIGVGASIIPNISIGSGSVIGAGAAVVSNVEAETISMGVPAVPRRHGENN